MPLLTSSELSPLTKAAIDRMPTRKLGRKIDGDEWSGEVWEYAARVFDTRTDKPRYTECDGDPFEVVV